MKEGGYFFNALIRLAKACTNLRTSMIMFIASPLSGDEDRRLTALSAIEQYNTINRPLQLFFRKNVDNSANPDYNISDKGNRSAVSLVWLQKSNRSKLVRLGGYFFVCIL